MIRAAESALFNIIEGCGCSTRKEFGRFLDISEGFESASSNRLARDTLPVNPSPGFRLPIPGPSIRVTRD